MRNLELATSTGHGKRYAAGQVRANVVVPGLIDTPHAAHLTTGDPAAVQAVRDARTSAAP